jgi:hypothetical protein
MNLRRVRQKLSNFWYEEISTRLFPRQQWLVKRIPRQYCEIQDILEIVSFESIIYYWENDGEDRLRAGYETFQVNSEDLLNAGWTVEAIQERHDKNYALYTAIRDAYLWARERKVLREDIHDLIRKHYNTKEFQKIYNWFEAVEKYCIEQDTKHLQVIVQYRAELWS